jgi:hypothetical protein
LLYRVEFHVTSRTTRAGDPDRSSGMRRSVVVDGDVHRSEKPKGKRHDL